MRPHKKSFFFVDDNFASNLGEAKQFLRALVPLRLRWVTQMSIHAAHDEEFLDLLRRSGCQGVLIGFESLNAQTLRTMRKGFNTSHGGYDPALAKLRRYGIRIYATFVFGYDNDTEQTFADTLAFALEHRFYITAFNHLTPFPGTPLYHRLEQEGRLRYERWWLDRAYRYNQIPFLPERMSPESLQQHCIAVRRAFYSWGSVAKRGLSAVNRSNLDMLLNFFMINAMHRAEIRQRNHYPLGDEAWRGPLLRVQ